MKLCIAIVEDEEKEREYLKSLIQKWLTAHKNETQITECASAEEFLFKYPQTQGFDLIFMDIMMKKMNGMELATKVRGYNKHVQIVFLTGITEFVFEGYKAGILRYLLKPLKETELEQVLDECAEIMNQRKNDFFPFRYQGEDYRLSFSDIIWVKVNGHYVKMLTASGRQPQKEYEWKSSLNGIKELLTGKEFVMINRSTIINLSYVIRITREFCFMENGEQLEISRNEYNKVNQAFVDYYL